MAKSVSADIDAGVRFSFWLEGDEQAEYRIAAFKAEEALFSLTKTEILLKITPRNFSVADYPGKKACLCLRAEGLAKPVYFSGLVAAAAEFFEAGEVLTRLTLLPALMKLEAEPRYRVFQELAVPDIVEIILREHSIAEALWQLEGDFAPRCFCMQYNESDLAFIRRILAEEGIFYYFIHGEKGSERPVFCNRLKLLPQCPNGGILRHDSHDCHGLDSSADGGEIYCHSLRRSSFAAAASPSGGGRQSAGKYADKAGGLCLSGIAHLPLPLCGHKVALSCPFDTGLSAIWYLTAVRHEGLGAADALPAGNLAEYFTENMENSADKDSIAADGIYGRAFGAMSLLPRLMQAEDGSFYRESADEHEDGVSPYGVPRRAAAGGGGQNIVALRGGAYGQGGRRKTKGGAARKPVYACAFSALDGESVYRPPQSLKPVIAGPQEAYIIRADYAAQRYKLGLRISGGGNAETQELCFWAYADTELGADLAAFAARQGRCEHQSAGAAGGRLIVEFLGGNPDRPIMGAKNLAGAEAEIGSGGGAGEKTPPLSAEAGGERIVRGNAEFVRANEPNAMPWDNAAGRRGGGSADFGGADSIYREKERDSAAPALYAAAQPYTEPPRRGLADRPMQAETQPQAEARDSRLMTASPHRREDIHGIYELNCGEKYLCRTRAAHINASDRLILRGPGGKIIIDEYSMTLEAPLIRLKGRLSVEEDAFDRQQGVKIAIRDELPLVAACRPDDKSR